MTPAIYRVEALGYPCILHEGLIYSVAGPVSKVIPVVVKFPMGSMKGVRVCEAIERAGYKVESKPQRAWTVAALPRMLREVHIGANNAR